MVHLMIKIKHFLQYCKYPGNDHIHLKLKLNAGNNICRFFTKLGNLRFQIKHATP